MKSKSKVKRSVSISWTEKHPESFSISYVAEDGSPASRTLARVKGESIESYLQRIGRQCICAAKGVPTA